LLLLLLFFNEFMQIRLRHSGLQQIGFAPFADSISVRTQRLCSDAGHVSVVTPFEAGFATD
jgi:hypothetical protein